MVTRHDSDHSFALWVPVLVVVTVIVMVITTVTLIVIMDHGS